MATEKEIVDTGRDVAASKYADAQPAPYYAKVLEEMTPKPGAWNILKIGIFDRTNRQLGEYIRNYHSVYRTFHPFKLRGKWYGLYSNDYTATRIMSLPGCIDIGGEPPDSGGFCPVDYWVPPLYKSVQVHMGAGCPNATGDFTKKCTCSHEEFKTRWDFPERAHGFIAGCVWGDDSSWKIQYLDLSRAHEGIVKREERFGYLKMPAELNLDQAIHVTETGVVTISIEQDFDLATGKPRGALNQTQIQAMLR